MPPVDTDGDGVCDDPRPLGCRAVVGLEPEARLAGLEAAAGELDVRDATGHEVGRDVDVVVDRAANEPPGVLAGDRVVHAVVTSPPPSRWEWWSRPRNVFAQALVPARALSFTTTGPSSIVSSSPYAFNRS